MNGMRRFVCILGIIWLGTLYIEAQNGDKPSARVTKNIVGWTVRIDTRLLAPPHTELGERTIKFLESKLIEITYVVSKERLADLQKVTIVVDLNNGKLNSIQYHPSVGWLKEHGYEPELAKCVHIPVAAQLATQRNVREQPLEILHELAHAYHDQVLDFENREILEAFEKYKQSGRGNSTLLFNGTRVKHYALTDHKEFFAEMTEAYFGVNDFFPFNRAELMVYEPEIYKLLHSIWGNKN
ncbi:MAG: metallopeptidase [Verrucomicrobiae bacterium]|nr:metallopeptidase [Verrucomicrobiae bacterium]